LFSGTRWLSQKQAILDLLVKAVYLALTLGAGSQTLGEEYTDIMPIAARRRQRPTVKVRDSRQSHVLVVETRTASSGYYNHALATKRPIDASNDRLSAAAAWPNS
jgi:hypothetical protein